MPAFRKPFGSTSVSLLVLALVPGCALAGTSSPTSPSCSVGDAPTPSAAGGPTGSGRVDLVIVGRIVTMDEPPIAEALLIRDGLVACVGTRDEVLAAAGEEVPGVDIGENVAYPGFIDAHAHWIGDREYYGLESAQEAMVAAVRRGWTSISEQWVNPERLAELEALAADDALPLRVDAYLAVNYGDEFFGDWYVSRERGPVGDRLRVQGLKIHLDSGSGAILNWALATLTETIGRANDAGWQVSVHAVSTEAQDMVLDALEAAIGMTGPNPLHHRIEHALQVSDDQLDRMAAMDLASVIQLEGGGAEWVLWSASLEGEAGRDYQRQDVTWLARWRDFVEAGLHVAASSDAPWFFPDRENVTDITGRPVDQIAGGMDARPRVYPDVPDWTLDQLLTAEQGLRAVTVEAAYALGDETRRGHLAPGTLGDLTILSGDVSSATADEIRAMEVIATIVDGIVVYCSDTTVCAGG